MKDNLFDDVFFKQELMAWICGKAAIQDILGIHLFEDWRIHIEEIILTILECNRELIFCIAMW